jgi:hypothetical protein
MSEWSLGKLPPYNRHVVRSLLVLAPTIGVWSLGAYAQFTGSGVFAGTVEAIRAVPPRGASVVLLFHLLPLAAMALGTLGRMQASRRGERGDTLGFLVVGLSLLLLPLGMLFVAVGGRPAS